MGIRLENTIQTNRIPLTSGPHVRLVSNVDAYLPGSTQKAPFGSHWQIRALSKKAVVCRSAANVVTNAFFPYYAMGCLCAKIDSMCSSPLSQIGSQCFTASVTILAGATLPFYLIVTPLTFALAIIIELGKVIYYKSTHVAVINDWTGQEKTYYVRTNDYDNLLLEAVSTRDPRIKYTKTSEILAHQKANALKFESPRDKDVLQLLSLAVNASDYQSILDLLELGAPAAGFTYFKQRENGYEQGTLCALIYHELQEARKGEEGPSEPLEALDEKLRGDDAVMKENEGGITLTVFKLENYEAVRKKAEQDKFLAQHIANYNGNKTFFSEAETSATLVEASELPVKGKFVSPCEGYPRAQKVIAKYGDIEAELVDYNYGSAVKSARTVAKTSETL